MTDWIVNFISDVGLEGVVALMFLENIFPPIPSEIIMPFAGFAAAEGDLNIVGVIAAGTLGSVLGAIPWYIVGRFLSADRFRNFLEKYGKWLAFEPKDLDNTNAWFQKHGGKATFFGRLLPTIRTLISVPAGMSRMPLGWFFFYTTLGSAIWTAFLAGAGYALKEAYEDIGTWIDPLSYVIVVAIIGIYIYRVVTITRKQRRQAEIAAARDAESEIAEPEIDRS